MSAVDLRSDTVTRPTATMREVMSRAELGDDVYGEDPSVAALEAYAAKKFGFEAALFVSSGTQGNLLSLLSHCERGDEYIAGQEAHAYKFEGGGAAVLGSIQPQPVAMQPDGTMDLQAIEKAIKPDDFHFARTRLICLENTHHGKVLPLDYIAKVRELADNHQLALHLDGARVCNAAVALGVPVDTITRCFDSLSVCLSKGLGAPVGSVICSSSERIARARRWRKMLGGGMRQIGMLAAAGQHALEHHVDRMAEDHANAVRLAEGIVARTPLTVDMQQVQTNMVFVPVAAADQRPLREHLKGKGVLVGGRDALRLVTHLDTSEADIDVAIDAFEGYFHKRHNAA